MKFGFNQRKDKELRGNIQSIREQVQKGNRYYLVSVDLGNGEQFEYPSPPEEIRKMKEHCGVDSVSELIGRPMVLKPKKK